ncbi:hypothetical protein F6W69_10455 [Microbacterium oxydans]|uniref:hypothetical protein n=1 Tax=Microbacterium oxydans TaxID=82380 RepID=UPI0011449DDB|nr:hypothetical protein [Microbacterium oxydans]KAB1891013.1 hypothetical protein F6W69_10455 [Microbacterium oxydans]GED39136.1 hypothetical protein MOX01_22780 [Microbacterium oxydans]
MTTNTGNDPTTMSVASAVRAEFSRQDKPKTALAAVIGVSRPTAYSRLRGDTPFTTKELGQVAQFLGITTYNLMSSAELGDRFADSTHDPEASRVSPPQQDAWAQPSRSRARRAS